MELIILGIIAYFVYKWLKDDDQTSQAPMSTGHKKTFSDYFPHMGEDPFAPQDDYQYQRQQQQPYQDPYADHCPYRCGYRGMRDCPQCKGRGAGMFDSYDVCPTCHDSGEIVCDHR